MFKFEEEESVLQIQYSHELQDLENECTDLRGGKQYYEVLLKDTGVL